MTHKPLLELRGLVVRRGAATVLDLDELALREGEIMALIGPNGAGKTTLLHSILGLIPVDRGSILFKGESIAEYAYRHLYRRRFAMVFQEPLLFSSSVYGNIVSGLKIRGISRNEVKKRAAEEMRRFAISHLADRQSRALSGGEAQRTSLARAFAVRPEVLLLDEPFASLDAITRESITRDLERAIRETGTSVIIATHDRDEALRLADRISVMQGGKIIQTGPPAQVMERPASEFVAGFVGTETILAGEVKTLLNGTFTVMVQGFEVELAGEACRGEYVTFCVKPESIVISRNSRGSMSARNRFRGRVTRITALRPYTRVHLDCGFPLTAWITPHSVREMNIAEGDSVEASFKATAVHVIRRGARRDS